MRLSARTSAAGFTAALLVLLVVVPGLSGAAPAGSQKDVVVVNEPAQPVPVTGTVNVGNTPSVNVAGTPTVNVGNTPSVSLSGTPTVQVDRTAYQDLGGVQTLSSSEECEEFDAPEGQSVMLQNVSVESSVFGPAAGTRPNVYLLIVQSGNLLRISGELFERQPDEWTGFWDVDVLMQPDFSSVSLCVRGDSTDTRAFATGYLEV